MATIGGELVPVVQPAKVKVSTDDGHDDGGDCNDGCDGDDGDANVFFSVPDNQNNLLPISEHEHDSDDAASRPPREKATAPSGNLYRSVESSL